MGSLRGFRTKDYKFKPYIHNANRVVVGVFPFHALDASWLRKHLGSLRCPYLCRCASYSFHLYAARAHSFDLGAPARRSENDGIVWAGKRSMSDYGVEPADGSTSSVWSDLVLRA